MTIPPLKGFLETSFVDWPGKICSVVFLPGCNLRCRYCHNHDLVLHPERMGDWRMEEVLTRVRRLKGWVDGVCVTGGEPTLQPGLLDLIRTFKREGLKVKLDTNGTRPRVLREMLKLGLLDYVAMDVKAVLDEASYRRLCGRAADIAAIRESIELIKRHADHEFRLTALPLFHNEEDIYHLAWDLRGARRFTIQNFSPANPLDATLRKAAPFQEAELTRLRSRVSRILRGQVGTA
ncbi:MAG: anaerobic ribonucleoside-triphosphate reductase activating protein [Pseudomonadota bacterium]